jgi:hypothetical protein
MAGPYSFHRAERKGPTICRQKISAVKIAGFQIQFFVSYQPDHQIAGVYAFTTEHAADRNWAEIPEEIIKPAWIALHACAGVI